MAVVASKRVPVLVGMVVSALSVVLSASPATAQAGGPGAQATPVVGLTETAACPTPVDAASAPAPGPVAAGPFIVTNAGAFCTSFSASTQGSYTVGGAGPLSFSSGCQTGGLQSGGSVTVPGGTVVNPGQANEFTTAPGTTTVIDTPNTVVRYPNGTVATLNVVETTATTVTRTAIVSGDTRIGRVICGAANVYPLAVDTAAAAAPQLPSPVSSSDDGGGPASGLVLIGGAMALLVLAQVAFARTVRRRKGDATA